MKCLRNTWNGDIALWKAFWLLGVLGYVFVRLAEVIIFRLGMSLRPFFPMLFLTDRSLLIMTSVLIATLCLLLGPYTIFTVIVVWRSSKRYVGPRFLKYAARVAIVVIVLFGLYHSMSAYRFFFLAS